MSASADLFAQILGLFDKHTAVLLSGSLLAAALLCMLGFIFGQVVPKLMELQRACKTLRSIKSESDFADQFNDVNKVLGRISFLKHGWREFKETLLFPRSDGPDRVIRNTQRPDQYLNAKSISGLRWLSSVSNYFIGIGLTLTFIGLVAALYFASKGIEGDVAAMKGELEKLLGAATFKFSTSIAGIVSSILTSVTFRVGMYWIDRRISELCRHVERGLAFVTPESLMNREYEQIVEQTNQLKEFNASLAVTLGQALENALNKVMPVALAPVAQSIDQVRQDIRNINDETIGKMTSGMGEILNDAAGAEMRALSQTLGDVTASLVAIRESMQSSGSTMSDEVAKASARIGETLDQMSAAITQMVEEIRLGVGESFDQSVKGLNEASEANAKAISEAVRQILAATEEATNNVRGAANEAVTGAADEIRGAGDKVSQHVTAVGRGLTESLAPLVAQLTAIQGSLERFDVRLQSHVSAMETLVTRTGEAETAMGRTSQHLTQAAAPVVQAANRISDAVTNLDTAMGTVSQNLSDGQAHMEAISTKLGETFAELQSVWSAHEERFAQVDKDLATALQSILDGAKSQMDSASTFVTNLDNSFKEATSLLAGNIEELKEAGEAFEQAGTEISKAVRQGRPAAAAE